MKVRKPIQPRVLQAGELSGPASQRLPSPRSVASLTTDSFEAAVQQAVDSGGKIDADERRELAEAFLTLGRNDQTEALDYLLGNGVFATYATCLAAAGATVHPTAEGYLKGLDLALADHRLAAVEMAALREGVAAMPRADRENVLAQLLERNQLKLFLECAQSLGDAAASIHLETFCKSVDGAAATGDISPEDDAAFLEAFTRLSDADKSRALRFLSEGNYTSTYQICAEASET